MARRTRDQALTALQNDLKAAQRDGKTAIIADCSLLLSHATHRPVKETPDYIVAVRAARNRQAQRVYRAANMSAKARVCWRVGDVVGHREAPPGEGPWKLESFEHGQWIAQPGNLRMSPEQVMPWVGACGACAALQGRMATVVDAFWSLLESPCGETDLDRAEAFLRNAEGA